MQEHSEYQPVPVESGSVLTALLTVSWSRLCGFDCCHVKPTASSCLITHLCCFSSPSLSLLLLIFYVFCFSPKLHHHQFFSHPHSPCLLHNIQLYVLQLRILIFPTRQRARANQERSEELGGSATQPHLPSGSPSLAQPINLMLGFLYEPRRRFDD